MHFIAGNGQLVKLSLPENSQLRLSQRMRLEPSQLEQVSKRMMVSGFEHVWNLAGPLGTSLLRSSTVVVDCTQGHRRVRFHLSEDEYLVVLRRGVGNCLWLVSFSESKRVLYVGCPAVRSGPPRYHYAEQQPPCWFHQLPAAEAGGWYRKHHRSCLFTGTLRFVCTRRSDLSFSIRFHCQMYLFGDLNC